MILPTAPDLPEQSRLRRRRQLVRWLRGGLGSPPPLPESPDELAPLVPLAIRAGLAGLLLRGLRAGEASLSPAGEAALAAAARTTLAHNLLQLHDAAGLARSLQALGVPALFFKGAALLQTVIPDPACRAMVDLDLLVRPQDAQLARAAAKGVGYRYAFPIRAPSRLPCTKQNLLHEVGGQPLRLEIHTHPDGLGHRGPSTAELLGRAQAVVLEGQQLLVPSREDSALLLAVHWTSDAFAERFKDCLDLAALVQQGGLSLQGLGGQATRFRVSRTWEALLRRAEALGAIERPWLPAAAGEAADSAGTARFAHSPLLPRLAGKEGFLPALLRPFLAEGPADAVLLLLHVGRRRLGDGWARRQEGAVSPALPWPRP